MKKIIILGASELQLPAIKQAKKMGLYVISVDFNEKAVGFNFCDKKYVISTLDKEAVLKIAKEEQISGIMTLASDLPMRTVAYVSEKLGLPGISRKTAEIVTDKYKMRECFFKKNIQSISYKKVIEFDEFKEFVKANKNHSIVKPISSSGSRGISWVGREDSLEILRNKFDYAKTFSKTGEVIVEEFLTGSEISVETVTINGETTIVQITDKITTEKPFFVELGHVQPAAISHEQRIKIYDLVNKTINAVGIIDGVSHIEIMIGSSEINVIEIGARLGGDFITTDLVPLSTGVNLVETLIRTSIGLDVNIKKKFNKGSAVSFFNFKQGIVRKIKGVEDMKNQKGIIKADLTLKVGDEIPNLKNSISRYGYVISEGNNSFDAMQRCKNAIDMVTVELLEEKV